MKKTIRDYSLITIGSILYALSTALFIFPHCLLLGGTSGISVILEAFLPFSPGLILMVINFSLALLAFVILGKDMAIKTIVGSTLTSVFIGLFEKLLSFSQPVIKSAFLSSLTGATVIALASAVMFYVESNSGGTDIIALIVKKYSRFDIGKSLLIADILIVIVGGFLSGVYIFMCSFLGLLIKTLGIDFTILLIKKRIIVFLKKAKQ